MRVILLNTWALFLGFAIISLAHGLQGTLIGVRAVLEGFSFISTGLIIAGYYFGFLGGSIAIPSFIKEEKLMDKIYSNEETTIYRMVKK